MDGVVGHSSSGLLEAPSFKIGTINIGDRQKGRIKAKSIIDCEPSVAAITGAIKQLYLDDFIEICKTVVSPYGDGGAAQRIQRIISDSDLLHSLKKSFYDLN